MRKKDKNCEHLIDMLPTTKIYISMSGDLMSMVLFRFEKFEVNFIHNHRSILFSMHIMKHDL